MIEPELNQWRDSLKLFFLATLQKFLHHCIDLLAICESLLHRWPGNQPALPARVHLPRSIVIGIEQEGVGWMDWAVTRHVLLQDKSLKKPTGVREVPFRGTDLRHGLNDVILRRQRFTKRLCLPPDSLIIKS